MKCPVALHAAMIAVVLLPPILVCGKGCIGGESGLGFGGAESGSSLGPVDSDSVAMIVESPSNQTVVEGEDVVFTCSVSSDNYVNISWTYSGSLTLPEASLVVNDTVLTDCIVSNSTLTLTSVTLDYEGTFTCTVMDQDGTIESASAILSVTAASVMITADQDFPVPLGDSLTLTCSVSAPGLIAINWTDNRVINTTNEVVTNLSNGWSTLTIPVVLSADLGDYVCQAITADNTFSGMITVTANISLANITFLPSSQSSPFYSGTELVLSCDFYVPSGFDQGADFTSVSFGRNGIGIYNGQRFTLGDLQYSPGTGETIVYQRTLEISPLVQANDTGQWTCQVDISSANVFIVPTSFSAEFVLSEQGTNAIFLSIPTVLVEPAYLRVPDEYGQDTITFTCTSMVPRILVVDKEIIWLVDGVETTDGVNLTSSLRGITSTSELQVSTPTDADIYNYTCLVIVAVEGDPTQQTLSTALVNVTVSRPEVIDSSDDVDALYQDDVIIFCTATLFDSEATVTWSTSASVSLPNATMDPIGNDMYNSSLTLTSVGPEDIGVYICSVQSSLWTDSESITVNVTGPSLEVEIVGETLTVVGNNVTLFCNVSIVDEMGSLFYDVSVEDVVMSYWWKFLNLNYDGTSGQNTSMLTVESISSFSSDFTCVVYDIFGNRYSDTISLNIQVPNITFQDPVNDTVLLMGDNVTFTCTVQYPEGAEKELSVHWAQDGKNNTGSSSTTNTTERTVTSVLTLVNVQMDQAGQYYCVYQFDAINTFSGVLFELVVQFAPVFIAAVSPSPVTINLDTTGSVTCSFMAVPDADVILQRNGTTLFTYQYPNTVTYPINNAMYSDAGEYTCTANNSLGSERVVIRVIVQGVPDPIFGANVTVTVINFFEVMLEWPVPNDNNNNITLYTAHYDIADNISNIQTMSSESNSLVLKVDPGKTYSLRVSAKNDVGANTDNSSATMRMFDSINSMQATPILSIPRVLVNSSTAYVMWEVPPLAMETNMNDMVPLVSSVKLTFESASGIEMFTPTNDQKRDFYGELSSDMVYNVELSITYDVGTIKFVGDAAKKEINTLPADNTPTEEPTVDQDGLNNINNLQLKISWNPLTAEDGAELLQNYVVTVDASVRSSKRRRRQTEAFEDVSPSMSSFTYPNEVKPFTVYTVQVLADLNVLGSVIRRPITALTPFITPEDVPSEPLNVEVKIQSFTNATVSWERPANPNGILIEYIIRYFAGSYMEMPVSANVMKETLYTLKGNTVYQFSVAAVNTIGTGTPSPAQTHITPAGVFPPTLTWSYVIDMVGVITVQVSLSDEYGPISHYFVVVVLDNTIQNFPDDSLLPIDQAPDGYYVTLASPASVTSVIVGDKTVSMSNFVDYENVKLKTGRNYTIFIRAYSGASDPNNIINQYRDTPMSEIIFFPSSDLTLVIVIPIILLLIVIIIVVIAVIFVCVWMRRSSTQSNYYLGEVVKTDSIVKVSPPAMSIRPSASGNGTRTNNFEMTSTRMYTPTISVPQSEIFTSVGQPTVILCDAGGTPPPDITWSKDGKIVDAPHYIILADNSLYITNTDLSDEGSYIISASNSAGTVEEIVQVTVVAPVPPDADRNHPAVTVSEFTEKMALLRSAMEEGLEDEYHDLDLDWNFTTYAAKLAVNHNKNRYVNIIPYDHSRVALPLTDEGAGSDYINASYIDGFNSPNGYIATQGPIPASFNDFWRLIWEVDAPTIVMVTNLKEDEKIKCHQYWPSYGTTAYGMLQVTLKGVETIADYCIRTFTVSPTSGGRGGVPVSKEVRQFHFLVWPDHGVPQYATALLGFRKRVSRYHSSKNRGPMIVHCSAGVGRTGTFITIDSMLYQIDAQGTLDIFNFVRNMRFRRNYMVQTPTQYEFLHDALLEAIIQGDTSVPASSLQQTIAEMSVVDPTTGKSKFLAQFETLEAASPSDEDFDCAVAKMSDNMVKNRLKNHLPSNDNRVTLSTDHGSSDYICASIVDGYRQRDAFIATQGPLSSTCGDFWRMVWEQKSAAIVMLTQLVEDNTEQCVQYWPSETKQTEVYGTFQVEMCTDEQTLPDYTVRKFKISLVDSPQESRTITQFHYTGWPASKCPEQATSLIDLIGDLLRVQRKSGNGPITVHCSDGLGRTGTFCAVFTVLERVKTEQVVDVFQTVKSMRTRRAGLLESLDQYEFVHKVVLEFLSSFDNYCNFK